MIPFKLKLEIRIVVDEKYIWKSNFNGANYIGFNLNPQVYLNIQKVKEIDQTENIWDPNNSLFMNKYTYPILLEELKQMYQNLKIPELYSYTGKRLELNESEATKIRKSFKIGQTSIELCAVVIIQDDERIEGIKLKFNNEDYHVLLTVNDLISLIKNLDSLNPDTVAWNMLLHHLINQRGGQF